MPDKKRLYIVVSDYPYGNGEPFLEDELIALSKEFERVTLVITNPEHLNDIAFKFPVPENVVLNFYVPESNLRNRLRGLWFAFTEKIVADEIQILIKSYNISFSFSVNIFHHHES